MEFMVERKDLNKLVTRKSPVREIENGEVLIKVNKFAFTSNNITYGVFADQFGYFEFYPCRDEGSGEIKKDYGILPVWGMGTVVSSKCDDVPVGEYLYGFFPMGSYCVFKPVKVTQYSLIDGAEHRRKLPGGYNSYNRTKMNPFYSPDHEEFMCLMLPLYFTAWSLNDFFVESNYFGAESMIIGSASSKTAIAVAWEQRAGNYGKKVIGLTSAKNVAFVKGLEIYDEVVTYDDVDKLNTSVPAVYIDMSGNQPLLKQIHEMYDENLKYSCPVGQTHWESRDAPKDLKGPEPVFYFAPAQIAKRTKELGPMKFTQTVATDWKRLVKKATASNWFTITPAVGTAAVKDVYGKFLDGTVNPKQGYICSLSDDAKM